jgi:5'-nucleotidase
MNNCGFAVFAIYELILCEGEGMKIILTNDDGFGEPGLVALEEAVKPLADVIVIAPKNPHSACGHKVNMKKPLRVEEVDKGRFIVDGSPADCVRLAVKRLASDADWVFAGINPGANLGSDVYQSGTVAAAREAAILGLKGVALSHYIGINRKIDWQIATDITGWIVRETIAKGMKVGEYGNINLPSPLLKRSEQEIIDCFLDVHPHTYSYSENDGVFCYQGNIHDRPRSIGSDVDICFSGSISYSLMKL